LSKEVRPYVCSRLVENAVVDPEPAIDLGYGTGTSHRPMTAVAGDLAAVGTLAAKVATAARSGPDETAASSSATRSSSPRPEIPAQKPSTLLPASGGTWPILRAMALFLGHRWNTVASTITYEDLSLGYTPAFTVSA
jgi:hypothetical protein